MTTDRVFRVRFEYDRDYQHETPDGEPLPGSEDKYAKNQIMALIDPKADPQTGKRRPVPYAEYCRYWGNPDRHIVLGAILEERCPHCGEWGDARDEHGKIAYTSLWGIDFMDDSPEAGMAGATVKMEDFDRLPGYLRDVVRELMAEAGVDRV